MLYIRKQLPTLYAHIKNIIQKAPIIVTIMNNWCFLYYIFMKIRYFMKYFLNILPIILLHFH